MVSASDTCQGNRPFNYLVFVSLQKQEYLPPFDANINNGQLFNETISGFIRWSQKTISSISNLA
ncbi:hypothetical protein ODZ84_18050 [Chryseobacterium fluminis]|uniref:hypothetical protein n=1 Tax=Chryseobacterium fluminis TaxID=2983606 RepID=UPI00224DAAE3|nr:hypothetical protein [Chryseobacterium sp. MMS21-Ot14]UZT97085.1 hypothetical protein ODZ84_18050 [Chryseobacterium sp. MMS21-Ot14]